MGIYCKRCGYEKQPWHAFGTKECLQCENEGSYEDYEFFKGIFLLLGIITLGAAISLYILTGYW